MEGMLFSYWSYKFRCMDEYAYFWHINFEKSFRWYKYFRNCIFKCGFKTNANTQITGAICEVFINDIKKECWQTHNLRAGDI